MNLAEKTNFCKNRILDSGFDLVGFARADELMEERKRLELWLLKSFHADMHWIGRTFEKRINPKLILPEAKSIISVGLNYYQNSKIKSRPADSGKISMYAWGMDYHKIIEKKFKKIKTILEELEPNSKSKFYVDYGPIMDKVWAIRAGLGWMGKHTNVINLSIGSWFFIGTIITTIEFDYDLPISDMCGDCRICIDACPTNAIIADYILDANKCISYHTIENKNQIPDKFRGQFESFIFGCDICQAVCPWNVKLQIETNEPGFASNSIEFITESELKSLNENEFKSKYKGKALLRAGLKNLIRNFEFIKS